MAKFYYEETYGGYYDAENKEGLLDLIREGKVDGPNNCVNSVTAELIGNRDSQYQIMGAKIDAMSKHEKTFYLWHLLRYYYKANLYRDREKHSNDRTTVDQINRILNSVEELDTLLCYDLF